MPFDIAVCTASLSHQSIEINQQKQVIFISLSEVISGNPAAKMSTIDNNVLGAFQAPSDATGSEAVRSMTLKQYN